MQSLSEVVELWVARSEGDPISDPMQFPRSQFLLQDGFESVADFPTRPGKAEFPRHAGHQIVPVSGPGADQYDRCGLSNPLIWDIFDLRVFLPSGLNLIHDLRPEIVVDCFDIQQRLSE